MKKVDPKDSNLQEQIEELKKRVEQLEIQNDTTQYNLNVFLILRFALGDYYL